MMKTASGASAQADTTAAVTEAVQQALGGLSGEAGKLGLLFLSPGHELSSAMAAAERLLPGVELSGCTTAGELTERGLTRGGVALLLLGGDLGVDVGFTTGLMEGTERAAERLCATFGERYDEAKGRGLLHATTLMLVDGLCGVGEQLVADVRQQTRQFQQIVGGAAGDDGAFAATYVGAKGQAKAGAAAAMHLFTNAPLGVGVAHGLRPTTKRMLVTKAEGNVVAEIDGRPAFEIYQEHAKGRGLALSRDNAGSYLIGNELGVFFFDELSKARAPLSVGDDGALTLAADVPQGSSVCILDGEAESMVAAARSAAEAARANLGGSECAGVLLFDCVCRGMILGDGFQEEIDAVRGVFPDAPLAGFLTYGEIARFRGKLDGWHNATAVVVAIPR